MSSSIRPWRLLRFGVFEMDLASGELRKNGVKVRIQEQPFQILALLAERDGELVTREELRQRLWPDESFGDFNHGLNNAINRLREVLGDSAESPRFVQTLPRRGYRLLVPVSSTPAPIKIGLGKPEGEGTAVESTMGATATPTLPVPVLQASVSSEGLRRRHSFSAAVLATSIVLVLALVSVAASWLRSAATTAQIHSLAVLPLENVSGDPAQEYFADGMTDTLTTDLAALPSLRVISRTSAMHYKNTRKVLPEIARELGVDAVVEGTVSKVGDRVRINAQLIDARTDHHLWADAYDRDVHDVLALQAELATDIAGRVTSHLQPQLQTRLTARKVNPEAYEEYLRGRYEASHGAFTDEGWQKARDHYNRAIQLDPGSADAIVGLAETYVPDDMATARMLASKALELNGNLGEAYAILGVYAFASDWSTVGGEREFLRALELDPGSVTARSWYGTILAQSGRCEEGIRQFRYAEQLDPLSVYTRTDVALGLYLARRFDEAVAQLQSVLRDDQDFQMAHRHLLRIYEVRGQIPEAIEEYTKSNVWFGHSRYETEQIAKELRKAYANGGANGFWRKRLEIDSGSGLHSHRIASIGLARIYAQLGDTDHAIAMLQEAYGQHDVMLKAWIGSDPQLDPLRSDPRFQAMVIGTGLHDASGRALYCR